jgi:3'-phosphoadenosine 5'-phosphosulfate sulfotransferase (PAPS reductase)/FAD synthetase
LNQYDNIIVSFSGGKDSVACVLYLLELGVPPDRIELWHQCVDGRPGVDERMWDWPCTESYCESFARAFGMRLLFQWKEKGFLGEMTKLDRPTAPAAFQMLDGTIKTAGGKGDPGTRLTFPAMSADLMTRWCSAYLKIDVAKKVFTNDPRFENARSLILTGERRQESGNRARYAEATDYGSTRKRTTHQWRAILPWFEQDVWEIFERYRVRPHPAYYLGWSRVSCLPCIFGDPNQWRTIQEIAPRLFNRLAGLEDKFYVAAREIPNHPFAHDPNFNGYLRRGESLGEAAARGESYPIPYGDRHLKLGLAEHLPEGYARLADGETWVTPMGAYGHSGGPT